KALVRVRERVEKKQQARIALGLNDNAPDTVVGRILVDQGMEPAEVARKTNPTKKSRKSNLLDLPKEKLAQKAKIIPTPGAKSQEPNFIEDLANNITDTFKPKESEYNSSFQMADVTESGTESKKSALAPKQRELTDSEKKS